MILANDVYLMRRIVAFCDGSEEQIENTRENIYSVCKQWRNKFRLHLWVDSRSSYIKALQADNKTLANCIFDYCGDVLRPQQRYFDIKWKKRIFHHMTEMLMDGRIDVEKHGSDVLRDCVKYKCVEMVETLLFRFSVDPSSGYDQLPITLASANGCVEIVKLLLKDDRVCDSSKPPESAIVMASEHDHVEVVDVLLKDARFNVLCSVTSAISIACVKGHTRVVERLLKDGRVDVNGSYLLMEAAQNRRLTIVDLLLKNDRIDPSGHEGRQAFLMAAQVGFLPVVERFLEDPRVDASANQNVAISAAAFGGHLAVVKRLLQDSRVRDGYDQDLLIRIASSRGHLHVIQYLFTVW